MLGKVFMHDILQALVTDVSARPAVVHVRSQLILYTLKFTVWANTRSLGTFCLETNRIHVTTQNSHILFRCILLMGRLLHIVKVKKTSDSQSVTCELSVRHGIMVGNRVNTNLASLGFDS